MPDISALLLNGTTNPWLYLPAAVVLGGLHALEPGHSKSVMAAFVIAVRGTPAQATLLGVSAAVGHTLVVWALALLGLALGPRLSLERLEPWLILLSGLLIVGLALRLLVSMHGESHGPFMVYVMTMIRAMSTMRPAMSPTTKTPMPQPTPATSKSASRVERPSRPARSSGSASPVACYRARPPSPSCWSACSSRPSPSASPWSQPSAWGWL